MPKRKQPKQANNLALWAGAGAKPAPASSSNALDPASAASAGAGAGSHIGPETIAAAVADPNVITQPTRAGVLVFKLNSSRLGEYQAKALLGVGVGVGVGPGGRESDEETVSDDAAVAKHDAKLFSQYCDVDVVPETDPPEALDAVGATEPEEPTDPPKPVHPFFLGKKLSSGSSADSKSEAKPFKLKGSGEGYAHGFFKPKAKPVKPAGTEQVAKVVKGSATPLPTRAEMHIIPKDDTRETDTGVIERPAKRRRVVRSSEDGDCGDVVYTLQAISREVAATSPERKAQLQVISVAEAKQLASPLSSYALAGLQQREPTGNAQNELWQDRSAPTAASQVGDTARAKIFRDWLRSRRLRKDAARFDAALLRSLSQSKFVDELDDFIVDDDAPSTAAPTSDLGREFEEDNVACPAGWDKLWGSNLAVLSGPHGCGKSALVHACAHELDCEVFEVNSASRRSGRDIVERVGEAAQSRMVNRHGQARKSLILFEEVDVLARDDKDFWPAVLALAAKSRRPVVLTVTDATVLPEVIQSGGVTIEIRSIPPGVAIDCLRMMLALEGRPSDDGHIGRLLADRETDLRGSICQLQFESLSSVHTLHASPQHAPRATTLKGTAQTAQWQSLLDLASTHARSMYLEESPSYELEFDDGPARRVHRDDLVGHVLISEPLGHYTELQPGDFDLAFELHAFASRQLALMPAHGVPPDWQLTMDAWESMQRACEHLSWPSDWLHDFMPRSVLHAPRCAVDLASDLAPALRSMARLDGQYLAWEAAVLKGYKGRLTRNTMQNEAGFTKRDVKLDRRLHADLLKTAPDWWQGYDGWLASAAIEQAAGQQAQHADTEVDDELTQDPAPQLPVPRPQPQPQLVS